MIETYLLFLFTYFIGFIVGLFMNKDKVKETAKAVQSQAQYITYKGKQVIRENMRQSIPTGQIKPPTAREAYEKNLPKEKREGIAEMRDTLDMIPDLKKQRELVERMRREGINPYE